MKKTKGIILAGGSGSRLYPLTSVYSKQLLAVYDKPMIYYPLSTLMLAGIRDILIISTPEMLKWYRTLFKDGSHLGLNISYAEQNEPKGIAQAIIIGEKFIGKDNVMLILGDNIFYGDFTEIRDAKEKNLHSTIFAYYVKDPERYGIVAFNTNDKPKRLIEKPKKYISSYAVVGLYIYDSESPKIARSLKPSARGELEITDLNNAYLEKGRLEVIKLGRGFAWLDTGTPESLLDASNFIGTIESRQSLKVGCIEEVSLRMGFLKRSEYDSLVKNYPDSDYKKYLINIAKDIKNRENS
ncbi:MAG: glucose-1-phosphate thymidylyltransferase RfbA [bacterium]|nr:glucose-1-phosphate thymidylyltransferase RfbA [bacterium]